MFAVRYTHSCKPFALRLHSCAFTFFPTTHRGCRLHYHRYHYFLRIETGRLRQQQCIRCTTRHVWDEEAYAEGVQLVCWFCPAFDFDVMWNIYSLVEPPHLSGELGIWCSCLFCPHMEKLRKYLDAFPFAPFFVSINWTSWAIAGICVCACVIAWRRWRKIPQKTLTRTRKTVSNFARMARHSPFFSFSLAAAHQLHHPASSCKQYSNKLLLARRAFIPSESLRRLITDAESETQRESVIHLHKLTESYPNGCWAS